MKIYIEPSYDYVMPDPFACETLDAMCNVCGIQCATWVGEDNHGDRHRQPRKQQRQHPAWAVKLSRLRMRFLHGKLG